MSGYVDGVWYDNIENAPEMGSIKCTGTDGSDHMIRSYMGMSKDADKMPTYVRTGSSCLMITRARCTSLRRPQSSGSCSKGRGRRHK